MDLIKLLRAILIVIGVFVALAWWGLGIVAGGIIASSFLIALAAVVGIGLVFGIYNSSNKKP